MFSSMCYSTTGELLISSVHKVLLFCCFTVFQYHVCFIKVVLSGHFSNVSWQVVLPQMHFLYKLFCLWPVSAVTNYET